MVVTVRTGTPERHMVRVAIRCVTSSGASADTREACDWITRVCWLQHQQLLDPNARWSCKIRFKNEHRTNHGSMRLILTRQNPWFKAVHRARTTLCECHEVSIGGRKCLASVHHLHCSRPSVHSSNMVNVMTLAGGGGGRRGHICIVLVLQSTATIRRMR
jgi:hypothetical protein